jgi:hypothetical protein
MFLADVKGYEAELAAQAIAWRAWASNDAAWSRQWAAIAESETDWFAAAFHLRILSSPGSNRVTPR